MSIKTALKYAAAPALAMTLIASNAHARGGPEEVGTIINNGGPEIGVSNQNNPKFEFSPGVQSELNNWIKNNNHLYNGGNNVDLSGLSPEASAELSNWVNAQGGSVEQEFGEGSFSPSSISSLVDNSNVTTTASSTAEQSQSSDLRYTDNSQFLSGAATNMGAIYLDSAKTSIQSCRSRFGLGAMGGDVFGNYGGFQFSYHPKIGVLIQDEETGNIYSALELGRASPEDREDMTRGMSDSKKELAMCVGTEYVLEFEKADQAQTHWIERQTHLHNLGRGPVHGGEGGQHDHESSSLEHVQAHAFTAEKSEEYEKALRCVTRALRNAGYDGKTPRKPSITLMDMYAPVEGKEIDECAAEEKLIVTGAEGKTGGTEGPSGTEP